jgi:HPt (histidine-containing phosphotransfer) domain-containing protein
MSPYGDVINVARQMKGFANFVGFPRCSGLAAGLELLLHQLFDPE